MANITFFIGNGFDLQMGLKTRYIDFYKNYVNDTSGDNDCIKEFKNSILQDEAHGWVNWADFEIGMGNASADFKTAEDFLACFNDFVVKFNDYLQIECHSIDWEKLTNKEYNEFFVTLTQFWQRINSIERERFSRMVANQSGSISFLQFNYTNAFDVLLTKFTGILSQNYNATNSSFRRAYGISNVAGNLHVHGFLGNHPVMGVDNVLQIKNSKIRDDNRVATVFCKQMFLEAIQKRNVNLPIDAKKALEIIQASSIICCFGVSIGDTDTYWWRIVGEWLKNDNRILVIFDICGRDDDGISPLSFLSREVDVDSKRQSIFDRFIRLANFSEADVENIKNKIIIEIDCKMFDFKLPIKNKEEPT